MALQLPPPISACDFHSHIHDVRFNGSSSEEAHASDPCLTASHMQVLERCRDLQVETLWTCATNPSDWQRLCRFLREYGNTPMARKISIRPSFGIHPWFANNEPSEEPFKSYSFEKDQRRVQLQDLLESNPTAGLGEIGLCKSARGLNVPLKVQEEVLRGQLDMASQLQRVTTIHCVGYYSELLEILRRRKTLPRCIIFHSFNGSLQMAQNFLRIGMQMKSRFFFSFSAKQVLQDCLRQAENAKRSKAMECCLLLPLEHIVLETDSPDQSPSTAALCAYEQQYGKEDSQSAFGMALHLLLHKRHDAVNEPWLLQLALRHLAHVRGVSREELLGAFHANSLVLGPSRLQ